MDIKRAFPHTLSFILLLSSVSRTEGRLEERCQTCQSPSYNIVCCYVFSKCCDKANLVPDEFPTTLETPSSPESTPVIDLTTAPPSEASDTNPTPSDVFTTDFAATNTTDASTAPPSSTNNYDVFNETTTNGVTINDGNATSNSDTTFNDGIATSNSDTTFNDGSATSNSDSTFNNTFQSDTTISSAEDETVVDQNETVSELPSKTTEQNAPTTNVDFTQDAETTSSSSSTTENETDGSEFGASSAASNDGDDDTTSPITTEADYDSIDDLEGGNGSSTSSDRETEEVITSNDSTSTLEENVRDELSRFFDARDHLVQNDERALDLLPERAENDEDIDVRIAPQFTNEEWPWMWDTGDA